MRVSNLVQFRRSLAPWGFDPRCEDVQVMAFDPARMAPEDIRGEPSLASIKTVHDLTKGYVHAQKLIGAKRVSAPQENWTDSQWGEFYDAIGRPKTADEYKTPDVKLEDGLTLAPEKLQAAQKLFHNAGLTPKQARSVMEYYMTSMNENFRSANGQLQTQTAQAQAALQTEWGDKFAANVDLAKGVIRKFGDQDLLSYVEAGMGNNVPLVKLLSKIGALMAEDRTGSGSGGMMLESSTKAQQEIDTLKTDINFQKALFNATDSGHGGAVERWRRLHAIAYPGKQQE